MTSDKVEPYNENANNGNSNGGNNNNIDMKDVFY